MAGIRVKIGASVDQRDINRVEMQFNKVMSRMSGKEVAFNINGRSFTQPLGRITAQANEFTKSLEASNARVIAFGASVGIINAVSDAFKGLVAETVKFEKTLADINVILNASNSSLQKFGDNLFRVAKNTAQSFDVVATAALEFSRQGLSMEETLKRTNDALILTRLTSLKAEEAVAGLTAAVNAFADTGLTTTNIIDKLAAVDVRFAVSSEDLIHALERTGAVAIDAGVELNDLIGLVTALQQTTARGGAVIGNGLKTIFTRIQRPESLRQIQEMEIGVKNLSGAILPADKILLNIAKSFDTLSHAQQSNIVQFSAGIFQANVFRAALRDLAKEQSLYGKASDVAANAAGEAALKNEKLNKTLNALASQSSTAVRELAGVMGDLMVKPELGTFMEAFLGSVESIKNVLGGGEEEGNKFAKGIVRGIGNVLTGPGLLAFGAVFVKMLLNVGKFASQSVKDVLGIVDKKEKIRQMEEAIVGVLAQNKHIQEGLNELEGDRASQEKFILKIIEAQTNAMVKQKQIAAGLAGPLLRAGVNTDLTVDSNDFVDLDKNARIDSFGAKGVIPRSTTEREKKGALQAGYQPGPIDSMEVKGMGRVVYNKAETVKKFPGMAQPAIMPPGSSRAGQAYKKNFHKQHGFDPYSELNSEKYSGFIPNYAATLKNNVTESQEKMHLFGTIYQNLPMGVESQLKQPGGGLSGGNIKFNVKTSSLTGKMGDIGKYLHALGVHEVQTEIPFDFIDLPMDKRGRRPKKEARDGLLQGTTKQKGDYAEGLFLKSDAGSGYLSTSADQEAVVDAIKKGEAPVETKAKSIDLQNILSKSVRRYSNISFRNTLQDVVKWYQDPARSELPNNLEGFSTNGEVAGALSQSITKLEEDSIVKNLSTLARMGEYTIPGLSNQEVMSLIHKQDGSFRKTLLGSGIGENEKQTLLDWGLSKGYIPNFSPLGRTPVVDYIGLTKKITDYSTEDRTFGGLGELHAQLKTDLGAGAGSTEIMLTQLKQPTSANSKAFRNAWKSVKAGQQNSKIFGWNFHTGFESREWTDQEIDQMYDDTVKRMENLIIPSNIKYAHKLGATFEDKLRGPDYFNIAKPSGTPHMDFPAKSLVDAYENAPDIGLSRNTNSGGDAYRGQKGHDVEHFIAKYLREKFSPGGASKITDETSQYEKIKHVAEEGGIAKISNEGRFNDIIGVKDGANRRDRTINQTVSLSAVLNRAKALKDHLKAEGAFTAAPDPSSKVQFKYLQDYVDDLGVVSTGLVPNFSRNENIHLYRGTKYGLEKAIDDRPNPPQFMFERLFAAKTKQEFIDAVINMGIRHSQGAYSLSYNDGVEAATLEQIRGYEKLPEGKVHHGGYIYNRPTREDHERVEMGLGEHYPSGFVSRSVDPAVAQRFASALDQTGRRDSSLRGHIEDRVVNTSRIFDQEKIEKYIDRFGLERVQKFLKKGMKENTLKELHLNLHKFRKKVPSTDPLDMFSPNAGESERSIGMSGGGLTHDEMEITQIWGKHSPYLDWHKGLVPNFVRYDKSRGGVENWEAIPDNRVGKYGGVFTAAEVEKMRNDGWARTDEKGWHFVGGGRAGVDHVEKAEREARRKLAEAQGMMRGGGKMIVDNKTGEMFHGMDHQRIAQENNLYDKGGLPSHFLKTHMGTNLYDSRANKGKGGYVRKMFASLREKTISAGVLSKLKKIAEENALILLRDDMHSKDKREGDVLYDPRGILGDPVLSSGFIPNFYNLNRRNLSDGDKMSDRQRLLAMWQAKMDQKAPYAKKILNGTGARIELDPIISELNGQANAIWNELQKLKNGEDYKTTFPFEIPNFIDLEKVKEHAVRGVDGEKRNAQRILEKRTIKSKNMFHDIILDAFLDNPNQDYPPGTSIIDHLISLGYDENQIRSAAKDPKGYRRGYKGLIPNFIFPPPSSWMPSSSSGDWRKKRKKSETQSSSPVETPKADGPRPGPSIYPRKHSLDALTPQDPSRFDAKLPFEIYRYLMTMGENSENIHNQMIAHQQGDSLSGLISYTSVDALRNKYKEVAGKHYRSGENRGVFNRFILDQSDKGLIGDVVGNKFISSRALLNHYKGFQGIDDNLYGKYKRYTTSRGPGGQEQTLFRGLVPNFSAAERVRKSQKRRVAGTGEYVSSGIRPGDVFLAEQIFDYMIGNISGLSPKFGFDKQTLAFRATSQDLAEVIRASKTATNRKNLSALVGEANLDRILRDVMTNHTEAILNARGQLEKHSDIFMAGEKYRGIIPNFNNPLIDAINREKAAGVPSHRIKVEKSSQLKSPKNPAGLAVTNTRDEPGGIAQGIRRARSMKVDPKVHGMVKKFTPNFMDYRAPPPDPPSPLPSTPSTSAPMQGPHLPAPMQGPVLPESIKMGGIEDFVSSAEKAAKEVDNLAETLGDNDNDVKALREANQNYIEAVNKATELYKNQPITQKDKSVLESADVKQAGAERDAAMDKVMDKSMSSAQEEAFDKAQDALLDHSVAIGKNAAEVKKHNKEQENSLQRLFFMQSAISMVNGQLQELAETGGKTAQNFAKVGMALSNFGASIVQAKEIGGQIKEMTGTDDGTGFSLFDGTLGGDFTEAGKERKKKARKVEKRAAARSAKTPGFIGKALSHVGKVGRIFGRFVPILGQVYTGFTLFNEAIKLITGEDVWSHMKSSSQKAAEKIEKLGKVSDAVAGALEALEAKQQNAKKVAELEAIGKNRTIAQEKEYYDLRVKAVDADQKVTQVMADLGNEAKVGEMGIELLGAAMKRAGIDTFDGSEKSKKALQELTIAIKKVTLATAGNKAFMDSVESATDRLDGQEERDKIMALGQSFATTQAIATKDLFFNPDSSESEQIAQLRQASESISKFADDLGEAGDGNIYADVERMKFKATNEGLGGRQAQLEQMSQMVEGVDLMNWDMGGLDEEEVKVAKGMFKQYAESLKAKADAMRKDPQLVADAKVLKAMREDLSIRVEMNKINMQSLSQRTEIAKLESNEIIARNKVLQGLDMLSKSFMNEASFNEKNIQAGEDFKLKTEQARDKFINAQNDLSLRLLNTDNLNPSMKSEDDTAKKSAMFRERMENAMKNDVLANAIQKFNRLSPDDNNIDQSDQSLSNAVKEHLGGILKQTQDKNDFQKQLAVLFEKLLAETDHRVKMATIISLKEAELLNLEDKHVQEMLKNNNILEQSLRDAESARKLGQLKNQAEYKANEISSKTVEGAKFLLRDIKARLPLSESITENVLGEAMHARILNEHKKEQVSLEAKSIEVRSQILENLRDEVRKGASTDFTSARSAKIKNLALSGFTDGIEGVNESKELKEVQKHMLISLLSKSASELESAKTSADEAKMRRKFFSIQGRMEGFVKEKAEADMQNLAFSTHELARRTIIDTQMSNLELTGKMELQQEILNAFLAKKKSETKRRLMEVDDDRVMLAQMQHDSEMEDLKTSVINTKDKLAIAVIKGDIKKMAELQLEQEIADTQKSSLIAGQNALILEGKTELAQKMKRANELQEMSNKLTELTNARQLAFVDQSTLEVSARGNLVTERMGSFRQMRQAGTKASITGNPDDLANAAQAQLDYNRLLNGTTSALDQVNVEMANIGVSASNLKSDLVSIGFDTARSELKNVFADIATGSKSIGDAFAEMGNNLGKALSDRLMEHNIDQIMNNLAFAFTGKKPEDEAERMRNAMQNAHQFHIDELKKQASASAEEMGKIIEQKIKEVEIDAKLDLPDLETLESRMNGFAEEVAKSFERGGIEFQKKVNDALGGDILTELLRDNTGSMLDLTASVNALKEKIGQLKLENKEEDAAAKLAKEAAAKKKLEEAAAKRAAEEAAKEAEEKARIEAANSSRNSIPAIEAEIERQRKMRVTGLAHRLPGESNSALKLAVSNTLEPHPQTGRDVINFRELEERVNQIKKLGQGELFNNSGAEDIRYDVMADGGYSGAWVTEKGDRTKGRLNVNRVKHESIQIKTANEGDRLYKDIVAFNDLMDKLKQAKLDEKNNSSNAAISLKELQDAAERLKINLDNLTIPPPTTTPTTPTTPQTKPTPKPFVPTKWPELKRRYPQITEDGFQSGGKVQKYHDGGFVRGYKKGGEVPAILQEGEFVIPRKFSTGGKAAWGERVNAGATGLSQMATSAYGSYLIDKWMGGDNGKNKAPTFDEKKWNTLGLGSDVDLKGNDRRLSARFRASSAAHSDYRSYLQKKSDYDTAKVNEKFNKKMGYLNTALSMYTGALASTASQGIALGAQAAWQGTRNTVQGRMGFGKKENVDKWRELRASGKDVDYSEVARVNKMKNADGFQGFQRVDPYTGEVYWSKDTEHGDFNERRRVGSWKSFLNPMEGLGLNRKNKQGNSGGFWSAAFGLNKNSGGVIPAMLTKGEAVISKNVASRIGYDNLNRMNTTGEFPIVDGKGGIDNVGPVSLNSGDFVLRRSSTEKLNRTNPNLMRFAAQNPDGFRRAARGYYDGGVVGTELTYPSTSMGTGGSYGTRQAPELSPQPEQGSSGGSSSSGAITNNINVNVTIDKNGGEVSTESTDAQGGESSYAKEKDLSQKIKAAVLDVIRQEKRVGGELS